jgi:hypothetical protein
MAVTVKSKVPKRTIVIKLHGQKEILANCGHFWERKEKIGKPYSTRGAAQ